MYIMLISFTLTSVVVLETDRLTHAYTHRYGVTIYSSLERGSVSKTQKRCPMNCAFGERLCHFRDRIFQRSYVLYVYVRCSLL